MSQPRLYNTLTRKKEDFVPLDAKNVRMYVCGPTVYDYAHIGNARPVIVFDVLFRLLRHIYGEKHVTYVRNITDVDDKINARAAEEKIPIRELTTRTAKQYEEDVAALGCLKPTFEPRATEHIKQMIALIEKLVAAKHAYVADSHVLYDVSSKSDYGKLSRRSLDEMIAGARVEVAPYKKNPMDFVLWKPSPPELPGWESPWGRGRPGWHIECSAMSEAYLGETFDIHGGGIDLLFPHHENEIAQSEGAHPKSHFAKLWMHNGFLQVEGDKMSKSAGNFVTNFELLETQSFGGPWAGGVIRLAMLETHYRQPINWTIEKLKEFRLELRDWAGTNYQIESEIHSRRASGEPPKPHESVMKALFDDLNTPEAIAALRELYSRRAEPGIYLALIETCEFLGIFSPKNIAAYETIISSRRSSAPGAAARYYDQVNRLRVAIANGNPQVISGIVDALKLEGVFTTIGPSGDVTLNIQSGQADNLGSYYEGMPLVLFDAWVREQIEKRNSARKAKKFRESDRIRAELEAKGIILKENSDGTTTWEVKR